MSVHLVARNTKECRYTCNPPGTKGGSDAGGAEKRERAAKIVSDWAKAKTKKYPVVVVGDMNSSSVIASNDTAIKIRGRLPYCIFTQKRPDGQPLLRLVSDIVQDRKGSCPSKDFGTIDHIYVSKNLLVDRTGTVSAEKISDHAIKYAMLYQK
ncbi:hypothetical protein KBC77_00985 [Candidatus Saccharibacteria bacterium]|nr:hypothetical protein [Candidatus Saccharibacteria bacterium]